MKLDEKLLLLRKKNGYSQEQLADKLEVARQTIGKWENGQAIPEIGMFIKLSELYHVTIDRLIKDDECNIALFTGDHIKVKSLVQFLIEAKQHSYAAHAKEVDPCRTASHDLAYESGNYKYYDSYFGGQQFSGEEVIWQEDQPIWTMNYCGRVLSMDFSGDFLKDALFHVQEDKPYRGPSFYQSGEYTYHCKVDGEFVWFQGYEEIFYNGEKVYECFFHGGIVK
ncbi:MAG: DUF5680 domain-containing protein [Eubacteriales bacterium]|nr:DUF5680 domain-containing protein [Eubacteriales bacterium]